jgi:AcrR family transcriptional regulator
MAQREPATAVAADPASDGRRTRHVGRREDLLQAATDYVFEHGLHELSLRPLAAALGVSHRTLLYHFGTKETLFSEILKEARTRERNLVVARAEEFGPDFTFVEIMWSVFERSVKHLAYFRVYYEIHGLALREPERYASFLDGSVTEWLAIAIALLERDGIPRDRAERISTFVWAASRGLLLDLLATGDEDRVRAGFEELVAAVEVLLEREMERLRSLQGTASPSLGSDTIPR